MLYSILIFGSEERAAQWAPEVMDELLSRHADLRRDLEAKGRLGPVLRLTPHTNRSVRRYKDRDYITDGPFTESKESLMGLYVVECASFEEAVACTQRLAFETCRFEISELSWLTPGVLTAVTPAALRGDPK
jgi:hypothetical protein